VFVYDNAGTLTLETVNWNQPLDNAPVNNATNATPIAVTLSATTPATGSVVRITGVSGNTAANGLWVITKTGASTMTLDNSQGNGAYSGGDDRAFQMNTTRATSLTLQNGVLVKSGDATRRYVGKGCTDGSYDGSGGSQRCLDNEDKRFLVNSYNQRGRLLAKTAVNTHTYTLSSYRYYNNDPSYVAEFLAPYAPDGVLLGLETSMLASSADGILALGANVNTGGGFGTIRNGNTGGTLGAGGSSAFQPGVGHNFVSLLEYRVSGTPTFYNIILKTNILG